MASLPFVLANAQKQQRMFASVDRASLVKQMQAIDTAGAVKEAVADLDSARISQAAARALGDYSAGNAIKESFGGIDVEKLVKQMDTGRLVKDAVAASGFNSTRMSKDIGRALGNFQSADAMKGLLDGINMKGLTKQMDTGRLLKEAVAAAGGLDSARLNEDIGRVLGSLPATDVKGMLANLDMAELAAQMKALRVEPPLVSMDVDEVSDIEQESSPYVERTFVTALLLGWFIRLPVAKRQNLMFASVGLLEVFIDHLEAAGAINLPDAAKLKVYSAMAIVAFVLTCTQNGRDA